MSILRRFWPPALWREIERLREDRSFACAQLAKRNVTLEALRAYDPRSFATTEGFGETVRMVPETDLQALRAENAELRRRLDTQQRRDHRGRFAGSVVRP